MTRLLEGEKMAPLCAEIGISRKTGYKIFERYKDCGVAAFTDRSRRPYRQANRLPPHLTAISTVHQEFANTVTPDLDPIFQRSKLPYAYKLAKSKKC